ncbi:MAG TPA: thiamine pyrophosphate-binding protein [Verrucomicrobiae bacterium]|nr:thiamine pyrophosphate-binding protein [Verrucomicrobiae bacterium]
MTDTGAGTGAGSERLPGSDPDSLGGHWIAAALASRGVDTVFTLPGGQIVPVLDGLRREGVRCIDVHHEGAACQMAVGWTLTTGRPGVAVVTAGAGFTHALSGLADGVLGRLPLRLVAGRTDRGRQGRGAVQDLDQGAIASAVGAGMTVLPAGPGDAARELLASWDRAAAAPPAPLYVEVPGDTAWAVSPSVPRIARRGALPPGPEPDDSQVVAALALLRKAERPVVLCGSGAHWSAAGPAVRRFARRTGIPVVTTSAARGLLPDADPGCLGGLIHGGIALAMADCVLVVGSRFDGNLLFGGPPLFPEGQVVCVIDRDERSAVGTRAADLRVTGDAALTLERLTRRWSDGAAAADWPLRAADAAAASRERWEASVPALSAREVPLHPARLSLAVAGALGTVPATVVVDGGDILTWSLPFLPAHRPGSLLTTSTTLGTVGVGLPYAVAAALAHPERVTVLISGDGALGLAAMELATAVRHRLHLVVVVANNGGWGDIRHLQRARLGAQGMVASSFGDIRFDRLATALGARGRRVATAAALARAVGRAVRDPGVTVLDVPTAADAENWLMAAMGTLGVL